MAASGKRGFWRKCRTGFRWFRIGVLLVILAMVGGLVYFNQVGLPDFIKTPVVERLRARGLNIRFTRLRWRVDHGIVAENARFGPVDETANPSFTAREVQLRINYRALLRGQFQVGSLVMREGSVSWTIPTVGRPGRDLSVDGIEAEMKLLPDDVWELSEFQARFAGAGIRITGAITNASAVPNWKLFQSMGAAPAPAGTLRDNLRRLADTLDQVHFASSPDLTIDVRGDALDLQTFAVRVGLNAPDAATPWGRVQQGRLRVLLWPATSGQVARAQLHLLATGSQTPWGVVTNLALKIGVTPADADTNTVRADLELDAAQLSTGWGGAGNCHVSAQWMHSLTNPIPLSWRGELRLAGARTAWGGAREVRLDANHFTPAPPVLPDATWGWWTNLAPHGLDWRCDVSGLESPKLEVEKFSCAGRWSGPMLELTNILATLYGGSVKGSAALNVATRELRFEGGSDFDAHKVAPLLTERSRSWLSEYSWTQPPVAEVRGALVLPAWTNRPPAWREVQPTLRLDGHFKVAGGAYRQVSFNSAESRFSYSNLCWRLPDLAIARPEGRADLLYEVDHRTRDYRVRFHSSIDLRAFRPLLTAPQQRGLDLVEFTQPPVIDGEVWGRLSAYDRIGARGRVIVTNLSLRGQWASRFETAVESTNKVLFCQEPRVERGPDQRGSASGVTVDFAAQKVYLTNGFSTMEPLAVARAIGPRIGRYIEPYQFLEPPTARVEGVIPFRDTRQADLHFDIEGGPFSWWRFRVPSAAGRVDWVGEQLELNNVRAGFYGGAASGSARFRFEPGQPARFGFDVTASDAAFSPLMADLTGKTNRLEGWLGGRWKVTDGFVGDEMTWQGVGWVRLRNGLIWEIPVFGIFSPVLDGMIPGLGSTRATEGAATFVMTNGVVRSSDLEIRASVMRLQYNGTVDLQGRVDARVEAELLRDTWVVGRLLSMALWPVSKVFEYQITGTVGQPKSEPLYLLPKIVMLPLHPFRTMKDFLPELPGSVQTNAPPAAP